MDGLAGNNSDQVAVVVEEAPGMDLYLPLVLRNYSPSTFPLYIGDAIAERPVAYQGEVFYTASIQIPSQLPSGGYFSLSSEPDVVTEVLVDDGLAIVLDGADVFSYNFSVSGYPHPAIVQIPRSLMEQWAGRTVTVEYRDLYGAVVQASEMWMVWTP
jgi:hypothetical protein